MYQCIHGATKTTVDVRADYQNIPKLDIPLKRVASKSLLEDGDVVFVDASEDDEGTSRHVVVVNKDKKPFISGLHTIVAKSKIDELAHEYRRYCFQTLRGLQDHFDEWSHSGNVDFELVTDYLKGLTLLGDVPDSPLP